MRRNIYIISILSICIIFSAVFYVRNTAPKHLTFSKPKVGDKAIITISAISPKIKNMSEFYDYSSQGKDVYIHLDIEADCIKSQKNIRTLAVYYLKRGKQKSLAYIVNIDYAAKSVLKRTTVYDLNGHIVPRNEKVKGWPVPFQYLLLFDGMFSKDQYWKDESPIVGKAFITHRSNMIRLIMRSDNLQKLCYQTDQYWKPGDWLWYQNKSSSENLNEYSAIRKVPIYK